MQNAKNRRCLGFLIVHMDRAVVGLEVRLTAAEIRVLEAIDAAPHSLTLSELARCLGYSNETTRNRVSRVRSEIATSLPNMFIGEEEVQAAREIGVCWGVYSFLLVVNQRPSRVDDPDAHSIACVTGPLGPLSAITEEGL